MGGPISPDELALLGTAAGRSSGQAETERRAFAATYSESMVVCAVIAGICVLVSLFLYRKNPVPVDIRRKENFMQEMSRRKAKKAEMERKCRSVTVSVSEGKMVTETEGLS